MPRVFVLISCVSVLSVLYLERPSMEVRTLTLNFKLMSCSLTSGMMGMYVSRSIHFTVKFTGPGLTHWPRIFGFVFSSSLSAQFIACSADDTMCCCDVGVGFPTGCF